MATFVKICGITRLEDALAAFEHGADAIGINFWPGSKRYCEPARARSIVSALPLDAVVYGVFVNDPREKIASIVKEVGLGGVQLHGEEAPEAAEGWDVPVIRAVPAKSRGDLMIELRHMRERASFTHANPELRTVPGVRLLVDNAAGGGSGMTVEWTLLQGLELGECILAGGLTPENAAATVARFRPWGLDTASGVESAPGIKDAARIADFIAAARSFD